MTQKGLFFNEYKEGVKQGELLLIPTIFFSHLLSHFTPCSQGERLSKQVHFFVEGRASAIVTCVL